MNSKFLKNRNNIYLIIGIITFILGTILLNFTFYNLGKYISYILVFVGILLIIDFSIDKINIKEKIKNILTIILSAAILLIIIFVFGKIKLYSGHPTGSNQIKKYLQDKYPTDEFEIVKIVEIKIKCKLDSEKKEKTGYRATVKSMKQQANFTVEDSFDETKNCKYKLVDNYSYNIGG